MIQRTAGASKRGHEECTGEGSTDCQPPKGHKQACMERVTIERTSGGPSESSWEEITWDDFQQRLGTRFETEQCWACKYSDHGRDREAYPTVAGLFEMFHNEYRNRGLDELCQMVHEYHEHEIRARYLERDEECPAFPPHMVKTHFTLHVRNPSIHLGQTIHRLENIETFLMNHVAKVDSETGEMKPDQKIIDLYLKVNDRLTKTYEKKPGKMLFHDALQTVDPNQQ